ncbi:MAG: calcium-binding EGF-like domain-containing protein [Bacteroidetes bacterium]|nr:calcium-binding EGF-like domain-containing protein [Bacteroidota bacterium]
MKKQGVTSVLFLLSMLFIASCKDEPCDIIVCQNNATCIGGICDCPPGFEGEFCEEFSRQKILGNFDVTSNCMEDTSVTETWGISASTSAFNEVLIGNFHRPALNIFATIVDLNTIEIEEQIIGSFIIYGSGTIEGEGNLSIQYTAISTDTTNCSVNALRQ